MILQAFIHFVSSSRSEGDAYLIKHDPTQAPEIPAATYSQVDAVPDLVIIYRCLTCQTASLE